MSSKIMELINCPSCSGTKKTSFGGMERKCDECLGIGMIEKEVETKVKVDKVSVNEGSFEPSFGISTSDDEVKNSMVRRRRGRPPAANKL